jgi:hypothetical protein
MEDPEL